MRVSEIYELKRTQPTLDFVDVDTDGDTPVFLSPRALTMLPSQWGDECVHLVQNFFAAVLDRIKAGKRREAEDFLGVLREPNETHLGLSRGRSRGRALGDESASDVWRALSESEAAASGLLQDLEDTVLMIDGISVDIVSDMTTNIIREPLIRYTQQACEYYGIELVGDVASGPLWDPRSTRWFSRFERLPFAGGRLLLVPKAIVRQHSEYDAGEYYRHVLLEHMRQAELNANTALVELLKDGQRRVTKKALVEKYGAGKRVIVQQTLLHPGALDEYRSRKRHEPYYPLSHEQLSEVENGSAPNWDELLNNVVALAPGDRDATRYETNVEALLTALFYPLLTNPVVQHRVDQGRKRIDITYTNMAQVGFFKWVGSHYPASHVMVECKNYGREIGNPELDQLAGRFSPSRGKVGLLLCRHFSHKQLFLDRCRDTAMADRGFVIPLDDDDLRVLVESRKRDPAFDGLLLLQNRFRGLVS